MKLKEWLTLSGTSQTDFARAVASPISTINRMLKGQKIPTHDLAVRIYFVTPRVRCTLILYFVGNADWAVQPNDFYDLHEAPPEVRPALINHTRKA